MRTRRMVAGSSQRWRMADKFKDGQKVQARIALAADKEPRVIEVMILDEESPGKYRVHTKMGVTMLISEEDIQDG